VSVAVVILAAGQGTRMKSSKAKVLHEVGGKAMVLRAVETAQKVSTQRPVVVVGRDADAVRNLIGERAEFVVQAEQLGTGHAVQQAAESLRGKADTVVVFYADMPLLRAESLQRLIDTQATNRGPVTLLTVVAPDPRGFGRIIRASEGNVTAIVEENEATADQKRINELNVGVYAFGGNWLWDTLARLTPKSKGEYYLTDTVQMASEQAMPVLGIAVDDLDEVIGVNTRVHLSEAETALRRRVNTRIMLDGVTIIDPATTLIHEDVVIGMDTIIYPNSIIQGHTRIGSDCVIGPNSVICDSVVGASCKVTSSFVEDATLEDHVQIGPFGHLRSGAHIGAHVHMGNFGEVKNSRLGAYTRMGHFSYIGDAEIGEDVNIGAGTITANYDGVNKNKTVVGDHAFIGSDTMLIAPVTIDSNARTAAGSVVTRDVPEGYIAVGVPARLREIKAPDSNGTQAGAQKKGS
jgi:bifunctional UDP-N-acetylglucosamine pyrophosphorylase/glucosamine-1-phosphate N-acetyltransferase